MLIAASKKFVSVTGTYRVNVGSPWCIIHSILLHTSHTTRCKPGHHFFLSDSIYQSSHTLLPLPESHPISIYMSPIYSLRCIQCHLLHNFSMPLGRSNHYFHCVFATFNLVYSPFFTYVFFPQKTIPSRIISVLDSSFNFHSIQKSIQTEARRNKTVNTYRE